MFKLWTAVFASTLFLTSCGGGGSSSTPNPPSPPANQAPVFSSSASAQADEGGSLAYEAVASDPDSSDPITYSLLASPDASLFQIDITDGTVLFLTPPDFEAPLDADGDNVYLVQVGATDRGGATTALTVEVAVSDISILQPKITFPTTLANLGGSATTLTVTGHLIDAEDGEVTVSDLSGIESLKLSVNGVPALLLVDAAGDFSITIDAVAEQNTVAVELRAHGNQPEIASTVVFNTLLLNSPQDVVYDAARDRLLIPTSFDTVFEFDLITDELSVFSEQGLALCQEGNTPSLSSILHADIDTTSDQLILTELPRRNSLVSIDLATRERCELGADTGRPFGSTSFSSLAIDSVSGKAYITDTVSPSAVHSYDLSTGSMSVLTEDGANSGTEIFGLRGIAVNAPENRVVVADVNGNALIEVDLSTGDRFLVSGGTQTPRYSERDALYRRGDLEISTNIRSAFFVNNVDPFVIGTSLITGERSIHSTGESRGGQSMVRPIGIDMAPDQSHYYVVDDGLDGIFRVSSEFGDTDLVMETGVGSGPTVVEPRGLDIHEKSGLIFYLDSFTKALVAIDPTTGLRQIVSDENTGVGPAFSSPTDISIDAVTDRAFVADSRAVIAVDLASGERSVISGESRGAGPELTDVASLALDLDNDRIYILTSRRTSLEPEAALYAVEISSGDRSIVSNSKVGTGPTFSTFRARGVALDSINNRILVTDHVNGVGVVFIVDPTNGDRAILSQPGQVGSGINFFFPSGLVVDESAGRALLAAGVGGFNSGVIAIALNTGDRELVANLGRSGAFGVALRETGRQAFVSSNDGRIRIVDFQSGAFAVSAD